MLAAAVVSAREGSLALALLVGAWKLECTLPAVDDQLTIK